jgi:hypothetical protein
MKSKRAAKHAGGKVHVSIISYQMPFSLVTIITTDEFLKINA